MRRTTCGQSRQLWIAPKRPFIWQTGGFLPSCSCVDRHFIIRNGGWIRFSSGVRKLVFKFTLLSIKKCEGPCVCACCKSNESVQVEQAITCNSAHTKHALRALCPEGSKGAGNIHILRHPDHNMFENMGDMTFYWVSLYKKKRKN